MVCRPDDYITKYILIFYDIIIDYVTYTNISNKRIPNIIGWIIFSQNVAFKNIIVCII